MESKCYCNINIQDDKLVTEKKCKGVYELIYSGGQNY